MRRTLLNLIERGNRFNINLVFFLTHWQMLQLIVPIGLDIQSILFSLSSIYIPYTNIGIRMKVQNLISLWRTYELFVINHQSRRSYHVAIMTAVMYSDFKSLKICIFNIKQKQMASYAFLISTALLIKEKEQIFILTTTIIPQFNTFNLSNHIPPHSWINYVMFWGKNLFAKGLGGVVLWPIFSLVTSQCSQ